MPIICYSCSFHLICFFRRKNCCWCLVTSFPTFVDWIIKRRILLVKVKNFHDFFYTYQLIHFSLKSERNLKNINLKIHRKKGSMLLKKNIFLYFNFTTFFFFFLKNRWLFSMDGLQLIYPQRAHDYSTFGFFNFFFARNFNLSSFFFQQKFHIMFFFNVFGTTKMWLRLKVDFWLY